MHKLFLFDWGEEEEKQTSCGKTVQLILSSEHLFIRQRGGRINKDMKGEKIVWERYGKVKVAAASDR